MTQADLLTLERRISVERFAPYRAACADEPSQAIRLYERNLQLSAAFWEVLSDLEILVRNAMHGELAKWSLTRYGDALWYMGRGKIFDGEVASVIDTARRHAVASGKSESPGRVIAELPLSFWRFLLAGRYERSLWFPCLRYSFPGIQGRGSAGTCIKSCGAFTCSATASPITNPSATVLLRTCTNRR